MQPSPVIQQGPTTSPSNSRTDPADKWGSVADSYDDAYADVWSHTENDCVQDSLRWLKELHSPRILDLGCGTGLGFALCRGVNSTICYTGLDASEAMLQRFSSTQPEAETVHARMEDGHASRHPYDAIVSFFGALSYASSLDSVVAQASELLTNDGYLRLSVFSRFSLRRLLRLRLGPFEDYGSRKIPSLKGIRTRTYTMKEMQRTAREYGFAVVAVTAFGAFTGVLERRRIWKLDRLLCRIAPWAAHTTDVVLRRESR